MHHISQMEIAGLESGVVVSRDAEALHVRRPATVLRVVVGAVAACSMIGLLAWSCSGGAPEDAPTGFMRPTPALAYVPTGVVPFKQPLPTMQRPALPVMQQGEPVVSIEETAPTRGAATSEEPLYSAETSSRRAVLKGLLGVGVGAGAAPAYAGYVTSLGLETTKPKDAEVDDELVESKPVQDAISNIKAYKSAAASLKSQFSKDSNLNLIPSIRKEFDFSKLRNDLNIVTTIFDDQTQLTIDRISRGILYDLTELENAARFKKGEEQVRTPKKIANVEKWFGKLDIDFDQYLSYVPAQKPRKAIFQPPPPTSNTTLSE